MFDFSQPGPATPSQAPAPAPAAADDDEWAFSSALPESNGLPSSNDILVSDSALHITLHATRSSPSDPAITMTVRFSSKVPQPITELIFQVAATKVCLHLQYSLNLSLSNKIQGFSLKLEPQTGRTLQPYQQGGITQTITLNGVEYGKGTAVKMRWKASYKVGPEQKNEMGEIPQLGVA